MLDKDHQHIVSSLASVVYVMHLAASTLGLGTQWVSDFGSPWLSGMTRHLLGIPQHCQIYEPMAIGSPAYYPKPRYVNSLDELVITGNTILQKFARKKRSGTTSSLTHTTPQIEFQNLGPKNFLDGLSVIFFKSVEVIKSPLKEEGEAI